MNTLIVSSSGKNKREQERKFIGEMEEVELRKSNSLGIAKLVFMINDALSVIHYCVYLLHVIFCYTSSELIISTIKCVLSIRLNTHGPALNLETCPFFYICFIYLCHTHYLNKNCCQFLYHQILKSPRWLNPKPFT